jgi:hypothetical protein
MEKLREAGALREENENLEDAYGFEVVRTDQLSPAEGRRMSGPPALSLPVGSRTGRDRDTQEAAPHGPSHAMHGIAMHGYAMHSHAMQPVRSDGPFRGRPDSPGTGGLSRGLHLGS